MPGALFVFCREIHRTFFKGVLSIFCNLSAKDCNFVIFLI